MIRRMCDFAITAIIAGVLYAGCLAPAEAQNPTCPTRPVGDNSNACASTAFVFQNALTGFTNHAMLIGRAPSSGFNALGPGTVKGYPIYSGNASTDPAIGTEVVYGSAYFTCDGATNAAAGFATALAQLQTNGGGKLILPPGICIFNSQVTATLAVGKSIQLQGAGIGATELRWTNASGGMEFTYDSAGTLSWLQGPALTISDLSISTTQTGGGTGLKINGNTTVAVPAMTTVIERVDFRGTGSPARWTTDLNLNGVSHAAINTVSCYGDNNDFYHGDCLLISSATENAVDFHVENLLANYRSRAVHVTGSVEGLDLVDPSTAAVDYGLYWETSAVKGMCSITGGQITSRTRGAFIQKCQNGQITGTLFIQVPDLGGDTKAIELDGSSWMSIVGNSFAAGGVASTQTGVLVNNNIGAAFASYNLIDGNVFNAFNVDVQFDSGANNNTVGLGNIHGSVITANIIDYGIGNNDAGLVNGTPVYGSLLFNAVAAPSTPPSGFSSVWVDSTTKRLRNIDDAGSIGTTVIADTGAANNFLTAISASGVISKAQPSISNISGLGTGVATALGIAVNTNGGPLTGSTAAVAAGAIVVGAGSGTAPTGVNITGLVLGNGSSNPSAYAGVTCTNQFLTALSASGAGTCTTDTLASAQHANQGTTTTVLHGNASGNPSWAAVSLTADITGTLGVGNGGTNLTSGTSGGILGFTASGTLASSAALGANCIVYGGGAGATPATSSSNCPTVSSAGALAAFKPASITATVSSGNGGIVIDATQSQPNSSDTSDTGVWVKHTLSASSATNELVTRSFKLDVTNSLTGGGHLQNLRAMELILTTSASATTDSAAGIYYSSINNGTVTNEYAIFIAAMAGSTNWAFYNNTTAGMFTGGALAVGTTSIGAAGSIVAAASIKSTGPTAGIGYATGAGGTVSQGSGSGKATAVTLNTITGKITMDSATLNAATIVSFTFNNSAIVSTDQIVTSHESGGTTGAYTINCRATGSGTAACDVRNNTAGNLGEAIVIRYSVVKSVNSYLLDKTNDNQPMFLEKVA